MTEQVLPQALPVDAPGPAAADGALAPHPPIARYYAGEPDRRSFVRRLFDGGAGEYDRVERLMALGSGRWYRRQALLRAGLRPGMRIADVAAGTGLVAREAAAVAGDPGRVVGVDPSPGMLAEAARSLPPRVRLVLGRAEELPLAGGPFDFLSMGYALRHVSDLGRTFREFHRVLRPGGIVCVMEMTRPRGAAARSLLRWYVRGVVPWLSRLTRTNGRLPANGHGGNGHPPGRRPDAKLLWEYYWDTIEACVDPDTVISAMAAAGFEQVRRSVELGIFSEYVGRKAGPDEPGRQERGEA